MARLASSAKAGFFPIPPAALSKIAEYLAPPSDGSGFSLLDPCCGKGAAIKQLSELLRCRPSDVHVIELDELRAEDAKAALPEAKVLAPCSFLGCAINVKSLQAIFLNPPFDSSEAGGSGNRVELDFLNRATQILAPHGVLVFVIPQGTAENHKTQEMLMTWFDDVALLPFPPAVRKFKEVVIFGVKRREARLAHECYWESRYGRTGLCRTLNPNRAADTTYAIPGGPPPARFEKTELTDAELLRLLATSPLRKHLQPTEAMKVARPPLALGVGHLAMMLSAGHLDGTVYPPGEPPHVVRGVARKVEYVSAVETSRSGKETTTKTVTSEKIQLVVRIADATGQLLTLTQE